MNYALLVCGCALFVSSGCANNPCAGQSKIHNAEKTSALVSDVDPATEFDRNDWENAGLGALDGGSAGAAVDAYMDRQQQEMERSLIETGIEVERTSENALNLNLPNSTTFRFNSVQLTAKARAASSTLARLLKLYPDTTITITGHTDDLGSDHDNQILSERSAASIANSLRRQGVELERLRQLGMGERMPKYPNDNEQNRIQHRRVEITIIANDDGGAQQGYERR